MPSTGLGIPYPDNSDDVQLWTKFQALAVAVDALLNLPDAVVGAGGSTNIAASAGSFTGSGMPSVALTNPSSVYNLICDLQFSAFLQLSGTGFVHVGVAATGGLVFNPAGFGAGGAVNNADNIIQPAGANVTSFSSYPVLIPAGAAAVTFQLAAMRTVADGTKTVTNSMIRIIPRRFDN